MSAIFFVLYREARDVSPALLERANACVRHRCPDGGWRYADGRMGMAHAELCSLPEDEPGVRAQSGNLLIAASCRIDNRAELRARVDRPPVNGTDTALLLAAFERWGEACVQHVVGDFAFVVWDAAARTVVAARDLSGARSLFYYEDAERLIIASDRTQLFQDCSIPFAVDEEQVVEYLTPAYQRSSGWDLGLFQGVRAVPAGSLLKGGFRATSVRSFWSWSGAATDRRSSEDVFQEYAAVLESAVACRLRSRGPVCVELSGGLDSSAVAALAWRNRGMAGGRLHALSTVFDTANEADERDRINAVLERYPLDAHFIVADDLYLPKCMWEGWEPRSISGPHEVMAVPALDRMYDAAVTTGSRTVLTGHMGDALNYGSHRVYYDLLRAGQFAEMWRRLRLDARRSWYLAAGRLVKHGVVPALPAWAARRLWTGSRPDSRLPPFFPRTMQTWIRDTERRLYRSRVAQVRVRSPAVRTTLERCFPPMIVQTMPYPQPVERRHPYADRRLIEFVLAMPQHLMWEHEFRGDLRAGRYHHRRALREVLPAQVRVANVGVSFGHVIDRCLTPERVRRWLLGDGPVHVFERGYVEPRPFMEAVETAPSRSDYVLTVLAIEGWLRYVSPGGAMDRLRAAPFHH